MSPVLYLVILVLFGIGGGCAAGLAQIKWGWIAMLVVLAIELVTAVYFITRVHPYVKWRPEQ